jgi:hypothetical protein
MDCPECGAPAGECENRYHACLVKEFSEPGYGAVHHLTVSAYMLQHSSKLTREGWLFERDLLNDFLVNHKDPASLVRQGKGSLDSGRRTFKIANKKGAPKIDRRQWTRTILDVRFEDAAAYCQDITIWARSVLADAQASATS